MYGGLAGTLAVRGDLDLDLCLRVFRVPLLEGLSWLSWL